MSSTHLNPFGMAIKPSNVGPGSALVRAVLGDKYEDRQHLTDVDSEYASMQAAVDASFDQLWALPIPEIRSKFSSQEPALPEETPKDCQITHRTIIVSDGAQIELRIYKARNPVKDALLFFVSHGGGWTVGSHDVEEGMNRYVASQNKAVVVSSNYRLAPEFPYPTPFNDCYDAFRWSIDHAEELGANPSRIIVGGGSAGGNLSAAIAQRARDEGINSIIGQVLNIPATCHFAHFQHEKYYLKSYEHVPSGGVLNAVTMQWFWKQYIPDRNRDAYANPLLAESLRGLPPALVQVCGADPLRDEGIAYASALKDGGVPVDLFVYPGLPHAFYLFPTLSQSHLYLQRVVDWISRLQQDWAENKQRSTKLDEITANSSALTNAGAK